MNETSKLDLYIVCHPGNPDTYSVAHDVRAKGGVFYRHYVCHIAEDLPNAVSLASLISTAPGLYAALEALAAALDELDPDGYYVDQLENARAALAKARGEEVQP